MPGYFEMIYMIFQDSCDRLFIRFILLILSKLQDLKGGCINMKSLKRLLKKAVAMFGVMLITIAMSVDQNIKCATKQHEIVFISSSVMRTEEIVDDLPQHADIVYLIDDHNGIKEITDYLSGKTDINTLRIISHGNAGYLALNGEMLDAETLARRREWISSWGRALSEDADIMLYGCNVAATVKGRDLVDSLAVLTGADVAASTVEIGGLEANWILDYQRGDIESASLNIDGYEDHLANCDVNTTSDNDGSGSGTSGTLRYCISQASSGEQITFSKDGTITLGGDNK